MIGILRLIFVLLIVVVLNSAQKFNSLKINHSPGDFTDRELEYLVQLQDENQFNKDLDKILIPRVVGSIGHSEVYNYIKNTLNDLGYEVETDEFTDITPVGNLTFRNIIASLNPNAERFFVVAAHYDSKYFENGNFLGATDSAVPCAMMLQIARVFKQLDFPKKDEVSLKFIFFDGEEAFVRWGPRDSIYGARHLANKMHVGQSLSKLTGEIVTDLQRVDCLMLLDLLGHTNPKIFNYFANTREWFNLLSNIEKRLYRLRHLKKSFSSPYFNKNLRNAFIEDDHIPFIKKGVPVLHIIPIPFPDAWHTLNDNADILDPKAIYDINLTIQVFLAHYLHVSRNEGKVMVLETNSCESTFKENTKYSIGIMTIFFFHYFSS